MFLLTLFVGSPSGLGNLYWNSFNAITEIAPHTREMAVRSARPVKELIPFRAQILDAFTPTKQTKYWGSVRLALDLGNAWLYVDDAGNAEWNGKPGRFDVLKWEKLLREKSSLAKISASDLVSISVVNRTKEAVEIIDEAGIQRGVVPAQGRDVVPTWFSGHQIVSGARPLGRLRLDFFETGIAGKPDGHLSFRRIGVDRFQLWKPAKGQVFKAELIVR